MYFEEKLINGILCYRSSPKDEFTPYSEEQILDKYLQMKSELSKSFNSQQLLQTKIADYTTELVFNSSIKELIRVDDVIRRLRQLSVK